MSINPRRKRCRKRRIVAYILFLVVLVVIAYFIKSYVSLGKPLFISPIGKDNASRTAVEKALKDKGILFSKITLSDCCYIIDIENNGQVKFSKEKDVNNQASSLQRILRQLTIEGKIFKNIDFRFAKPTISFE